jgi:hypothetical protein
MSPAASPQYVLIHIVAGSSSDGSVVIIIFRYLLLFTAVLTSISRKYPDCWQFEQLASHHAAYG